MDRERSEPLGLLYYVFFTARPLIIIFTLRFFTTIMNEIQSTEVEQGVWKEHKTIEDLYTPTGGATVAMCIYEHMRTYCI